MTTPHPELLLVYRILIHVNILVNLVFKYGLEIVHVKMLVFEERGKPEYLEKNLSEKRREPTTNSTHIWHQHQDLNLDHIGGRQGLSPVRHTLLSSRVGAKSRIPSKNLVFFQIQLCNFKTNDIVSNIIISSANI